MDTVLNEFVLRTEKGLVIFLHAIIIVRFLRIPEKLQVYEISKDIAQRYDIMESQIPSSVP